MFEVIKQNQIYVVGVSLLIFAAITGFEAIFLQVRDGFGKLIGKKPKLAGTEQFWTQVFNADPSKASLDELKLKHAQMTKFFENQTFFKQADLKELNEHFEAAVSSISGRDFFKEKLYEQSTLQKAKDALNAQIEEELRALARKAFKAKMADELKAKVNEKQRTAPPPPRGVGSRALNWRVILDVPESETKWEVVRKAYKAKLHHPDLGGNPEQASKLGEALSLAKLELLAA